MYYDIHTHNRTSEPGVVQIYNMHQPLAATADNGLLSAGLHPWYITDVAAEMAMLEQVAASDNVIAIGECGLDKVCATDMAIQTDAFGRQIALAECLRKPLIIHCVRAYEEVRAILTKQRVSVPVVFHGYNKKRELAAQLTAQGWYLSFGSALLNNSSAGDALAAIPADRFLLETDNSNISVREIYSKAAGIRKKGEDELILQLTSNFKNVFGR